MREQSRKRERHNQAKTIEQRLTQGSSSRGVYLFGLRACRLMAALSQRELAKVSGTCQSAIHALESQQRAAYPKTVRRLSQALEVEPVDLICGGASKDLK